MHTIYCPYCGGIVTEEKERYYCYSCHAEWKCRQIESPLEELKYMVDSLKINCGFNSCKKVENSNKLNDMIDEFVNKYGSIFQNVVKDAMRNDIQKIADEAKKEMSNSVQN